MKQAVSAGILVVLGVLAACGSGRPEGEMASGMVEITATATADGVELLSGGVTGSNTIAVDGTMLDEFGVATSTYTWNAGDPVVLSLDANGGFHLDLVLSGGAGELVLEGTSIVGEEVSTLTLSFVLDQEPPVLEAPTAAFSATIVGEEGMTMNKQELSFNLTGGTDLPVIDGVTFTKYASTYGPENDNRPVWLFRATDNHSLVDARYEFRVSKGAEELVPWTEADTLDDGLYAFAISISSALHPDFATKSGTFALEVRASDAAGNMSETLLHSWTQTLLSPPMYIATGDEGMLPAPEGIDPRLAVLGENFSDIYKMPGMLVGVLRVANPNNTPVLVQVETTDFTSDTSWMEVRTWSMLSESFPAPFGTPCLSGNTVSPGGACMGDPWDFLIDAYYKIADDANVDNGDTLEYSVYDVLGDLVFQGNEFVIPQNTAYNVVARLQNAPSPGLLPSPLDEVTVLNPSGPGGMQKVTARSINQFYHCKALVPNSIACKSDAWSFALDYDRIDKVFGTWSFASRVRSKVNLDTTDATPWNSADPNDVPGHTVQLVAPQGMFAPSSHEEFN